MQSFTKRWSIFLSTIYHFYFVSLFILHTSIVYDDDFCVAYNYLYDNRKLVAKVVFSTFVAKWPIFRCISKKCWLKIKAAGQICCRILPYFDKMWLNLWKKCLPLVVLSHCWWIQEVYNYPLISINIIFFSSVKMNSNML